MWFWTPQSSQPDSLKTGCGLKAYLILTPELHFHGQPSIHLSTGWDLSA